VYIYSPSRSGESAAAGAGVRTVCTAVLPEAAAGAGTATATATAAGGGAAVVLSERTPVAAAASGARQLFDSTAMRDASVANLTIPGHTTFINISTANYILAGLQRVNADTPQGTSWAALARDLGYNYKNAHQRLELQRLVSTRMLPFGICAGSEKQGGQHETGLAPVQAAANHVTTLTVDGQNRDLVNLWRNVDLSAGNTLIFKLAWLPTQLKPAPGAPWPHDYRINGYWRIGQVFQHRASC